MSVSSDYVFGANILDNLTTGMYTDSRVIYREYIQNACDSIDEAEKKGILAHGKGAVEIYTNDSDRTITIHDNGMGISEQNFRRTLGNIANSGKTLGESKGFRGIGRLCGLAYCETLVFSSKAQGESTISYMICDARLMRQLINQNQSQQNVKLSAAEVLNQIISYDVKESKDLDEHWFEVELINVNAENHELLARESVIDYLSFVAPVPFNKNFSYRTAIYNYLKENTLQLDEYVIKVNGEQIFKDYRTYVKTSKGDDHIFDVQFKRLFDDNGELIAWMWYGLRTFRAVIEKDSLQRGLRLRKENIQIGDEDVLQHLFKEERGAHYFVGEVHAIARDLIPNSQRDYFNENYMRNIFEREIEQYFETLHRLYHTGNDFSAAVDKIETYEKQHKEFVKKKKSGDYINDDQQKDAEVKVEKAKKNADDALKKISTVTDRYKGDTDSPIYKVVKRIAKDRGATEYISADDQKKHGYSSKEEEVPVNTKDEDTSQTGPQKKKTKWWTDRLPSVPKSERKLITRIIGVVRECVDETTMNKILDKIEEEFK